MKLNYKEYSMKALYGLLENLDKEEDFDLIAETIKEIQLRKADPDYQKRTLITWNHFRFFRMSSVVSAPLVILFAFLAKNNSTFYGYLSFACIFIFCFSVLYTTLWKCPHCGKLFCTGMIGIFSSNIPFRNTCIHCGYRVIPKG
jgi:hypothetical protein